MVRLTAKNLWSHKRRMVGTALAVVLGVAFLAGTLLLGDTLQANFDRLFTQAYGQTDVVVRSATTIGNDPRQNMRAGIDADVLPVVRAVPGVADAQPYLEANGQLLGSNGKAIGGNGPPTRAGNWISDSALSPYKLVEGRAPRADDEVVINRGAAKTGHLSVGDRTTLLTPQPVSVRIVGISTFGTADGFGPGTFTGMTLHAAQTLLTNNPSQLTEIRVRAVPGISADALATRIGAKVPANVQTITGSELASERLGQLNDGFLGFFKNALLAFSLIALLVAAFSIYNTFSILAAQRGRETALERALGATRGQVLGAGALEALAVGLAGSAVGVFAGVVIAAGLKALFSAFGFSLPAGGLVLRPSSMIVAIAVGTVATLVAAWLPAHRASRTAPIAALREVDTDTESTGATWRRATIGALVGAVGVGAIVLATAGSGGVGLAALGAVFTLVAAVVLGPVVARPAAAVLGAPAARRDINGRLSRDNAMRNPRRTAATASSLMIGVSVVALFTVVGASLRASVQDGVGKSLHSDLVVDTKGFGGASGGSGLSPTLANSIAQTPGVEDAVGIGTGTVEIAGSAHQVSVAPPSSVDQVLQLGVSDGSLAQLSDDGLAVSSQAAKDHHWHVGSEVAVLYPDGANGELRVGAVYDHPDIVGDYLLTPAEWTPHASQPLDSLVLVNVEPGTSLDTAKTSISHLTDPYGVARVQDRDQYVATAASGVNTILGLVYVMLVLAIVIALMGIANTLSLSVYERRRELGVLRAVGQTRAQMRSMIRWEAVTIATFGTLGGLALGTFLAWALVTASSSTVLAVFAIPPARLVVFAVLGAAAGALAAIRPARRAARLDILAAIASD